MLSNLFVIKILRFLGQIFLVEKLSSRNGLCCLSATVHRKTPFLVLWSLFLPYCAFQKHANSKVQTPPSQLRFWLPSIIITIISNEPWSTETHKTDGNLPITNQKPWPFEPVKVKFCFLKLRSVKMIDGSEKRNPRGQLAFELQNNHVCEKRSKKVNPFQGFCRL